MNIIQKKEEEEKEEPNTHSFFSKGTLKYIYIYISEYGYWIDDCCWTYVSVCACVLWRSRIRTQFNYDQNYSHNTQIFVCILCRNFRLYVRVQKCWLSSNSRDKKHISRSFSVASLFFFFCSFEIVHAAELVRCCHFCFPLSLFSNNYKIEKCSGLRMAVFVSCIC